MRIAFLGASDFGFKCLEIITKIEGINICGVISNLRTFKISYNQSTNNDDVFGLFFERKRIMAFHKSRVYLLRVGVQ